MQLYVRTPCGRCIPVHVDSSRPVSHVRSLVERAMGVSLHPQQRLTFADEALDETRLLTAYEVAHGSTLFLTLPQGGTERLWVDRADGERLSVSVNPQDPIGAVKRKVEEITAVRVCQQRLIFAGLELMDDWTLEECSIRSDSVLSLTLRPALKLFVQVFNGAMFPVSAWPSDTIRRVKERIQEIRGYPLHRQRLKYDWREVEDDETLLEAGIEEQGVVHLSLRTTRPSIELYVNCGQRGTLTLHVDPDADISRVKEEIHERLGVLPAHQHLNFNGPELHSGRTLAEYEVMDRAVLLLDVSAPLEQELDVTVETLTGDRVPLRFRPSDTVASVKKALKMRQAVPEQQQILVFNGEHLSDARTLREVGVNSGGRLKLLVSVRAEMRVFVKSEGLPVLSFTVEPSDTVHTIKRQIEEKTGVLIRDQRLLYVGTTMQDHLPLSAYEVTPESSLFLSVSADRVHISVATMNGRVFPLAPDRARTVAALKEMIREKEGIPVPLQQLTFNGSALADASTLAENAVLDGSVLTLAVRLSAPMTVFVRCQNGRTLQLDVEPTHSVAAVRQLVHEQTLLPFSQIRLVFNNSLLQDTNLLRHHDVRHGCTLYLDHRPVRTFPVTVEMPGERSRVLNVNKGWRVRDVKAEVARLEEDPDLPDLRLVFNGLVLSDEKKLKEYSIQEKSVLRLSDRLNGRRADVFISYQWDRQKTVKGLFLRLTELGYSCWMDESEMGGGDKLFEEIDRGLRECKVVISCVTPQYTVSTNCRREVCRADNLKKPVIPIMLDQTEWLPEGPMAMIFTELLYINFYDFPDQVADWDGPQVDKLLEQLNKYVSARPQ